MNRFASGLVAVLLIVVVAPGSVAAANLNFHATAMGTWIDDDFCGTGVTIVHTYTDSFTFHAFQATDHARDVLSNPLTGDSIEGTSAGLLRGEFAGDPEGIHTFTFSHAGLQEKIKLPQGPVLIMNAGHVVSVVTFDGDLFISEVNTMTGRHDYTADPDLLCELGVPVLGIG